MSFDPVTSILNIGGKLIDKLLPNPEAKAAATLKLEELKQSGELAVMAKDTEVFKAEQEAITGRWQSDMTSDSWLAKNVRPMTLVYILSAYLGLAVADGVGFKVACQLVFHLYLI